ncbi:MAG: indolepyruvate oxidoreductase subunit beta [Eubacterium sp.]|nr:indolepyruvate oxidoreductase subunit beta [Eubacterium sp.]
MMKNIILTGVGGQGTVLASKLIAAAAMEKDIPVTSAETIGMAQRGGSVFSHLRMGEGVHSPMILPGEGDLLIGFEPGEALRMLPYLKEDAPIVTSVRPVIPVTAALAGGTYDGRLQLDYLKSLSHPLYTVDPDEAIRELGNPKVMNVVLLGAAVATGLLGLEPEDVKQAIRIRLPEKLQELNFRALEYGMKLVSA